MELLFALFSFPLESAALIYLTLFLILILSGIGLPVPEEATLLLGGYLAYLEFTEFYMTLYVLIAGIIAADMFGYLLGRYGGKWVSQRISHFQIASFFLEKGKRYFERYGEKVVLFSRPLLGIRVVVPILAGHFKIRFEKFLLFDISGAIPWTVFLVSISYYFGAGLDWAIRIRAIKHGIFLLFVLAVLVFVALRFLKNRKSAGLT